MPRPCITTVSPEDKLRLEQDARDAERAGWTVYEFRRVLDSASFALIRVFPAARTSFIFHSHRFHAISEGGILSIYRTKYNARPDRLICERRAEN
jgi:hypothetical protein